MLKYFEDRSVFDAVNLIAGIGLALSPWLLGFAGEGAAAWNAWIVGFAIALLAAAAFYAFHQPQEWAKLLLGFWAVAAPWALGFSAVQAAAAIHVVTGLVVAVTAGIQFWRSNNRPFSTA